MGNCVDAKSENISFAERMELGSSLAPNPQAPEEFILIKECNCLKKL